jgi:hypothetical protein
MSSWSEKARRAAEFLGVYRKKAKGWVLKQCPSCNGRGGVAFISEGGRLSCKRASCLYHDGERLQVWTAELLGWGQEELQGELMPWQAPRRPEAKLEPPATGTLWTPLIEHQRAQPPEATNPTWRWATELRGWSPEAADGLLLALETDNIARWVEQLDARRSGAGSLWSSAHRLWIWLHDKDGRIISAARRATQAGVNAKELSLSNEASRARDVRLAGHTLPEACAIAERGGEVWICEGMPDTLAALAVLKAAGREGAVIGFPGTSEANKGANAIRQAFASKGLYARFLIWPHNDASGAGQRAAADVARRLRLAGEVRVAGLQDPDLSDALRDRDVEGVLEIADSAAALWNDEPDREKRRELTRSAVQAALQGTGILTLKVPPGDGKSTATLKGIAELAAHYKRGTAWKGCVASPTHDLASEVFERLEAELQAAGCSRLGTSTAGEACYSNPRGAKIRVIQLFALNRQDADGPVCIHPEQATEAARTVEGGLSAVCRGCENSHELQTKKSTRLIRNCRWGRRLAVADEKKGINIVIGTHHALWPRDEKAEEREWDLAVIDESPLKNRAEEATFTLAQLQWARGADLLEATKHSWDALSSALATERSGLPIGAGSGGLARIMGRVKIAPLEAWRDAAEAPAKRGEETSHLPDWKAVEALEEAQKQGWTGCYVFGGQLHLWRQRPKVRAKNVIYLDATSTPYLSQAIAPGSQWAEIEALIPDRWTILRTSETFSKRGLDPKRGSGLKKDLWRATLHHAAELDRELGGTGPLIVAPGCSRPGFPVGKLEEEGLEDLQWTYYGAADAVGSNLHKDRRVVVLTDFYPPRLVIEATAERIAALRGEAVSDAAREEADRQLRERAVLQAMGRLRGESVTVLLCTAVMEGSDTETLDLCALALGAGHKPRGREASIAILRTWVERAGIALPDAAPTPELAQLHREAIERVNSTWSGSWRAAADDAGLIIQEVKVLGLTGGRARVALALDAQRFLQPHALAEAAWSIQDSAGVELRGRAILWSPDIQAASRQAPLLARDVWTRRQEGLSGRAALAAVLRERFDMEPRRAGRIRDRLLEEGAQVWLAPHQAADLTWLRRAAEEDLDHVQLEALDALASAMEQACPHPPSSTQPHLSASSAASKPPPGAPDYEAALKGAQLPDSWPDPEWSEETVQLFFLLGELLQEGHAPPGSFEEAQRWSPLLERISIQAPP